jgi:hypothetical protein
LDKPSYGKECLSPDGRENPFVPGFDTKDWKDSRKKLLIKNEIPIIHTIITEKYLKR